MSNVNIKRAVENIRSGTNVYTPVIEMVVNGIQAIEELGRDDGLIEIVVHREEQIDFISGLPSISGFDVVDNGVGLNQKNRNSYDELYTDHKIDQGGKGFGRFTCLKYFENVRVESVFFEGSEYKKRNFHLGKERDIISGETIETVSKQEVGTRIVLSDFKKIKFQDKKLDTIAKMLVESLLPYFIRKNNHFPKIVLREYDESKITVLNDYVKSSDLIEEIISANRDFSILSVNGDEVFEAKVFKFYSPRVTSSKISLVAHCREVTSTSIHKYIPEFVDEFYEEDTGGEERNFIIKVYIFGKYLDDHVSLERGGFEFKKDSDVVFGISQENIELFASDIASLAVHDEMKNRAFKKANRVNDYVKNKAPWHFLTSKEADLSDLPYNATDEQIENKLQVSKYKNEIVVRAEIKNLIENDDVDDVNAIASEIVSKINDSSKNDLAHYVALRKSVIDIFEKSLEIKEDGKHSSEGLVHDIIFPRRKDSEGTSFENHNLWLIDERLNFSEYLSSDMSLEGNSDRPDLLIYDNRVAFRGENEATNPVTIFEFKKPGRDDFANPSSKDDPVAQIVRYVRKIRQGEFETPNGREILISGNTPFYGYVVCDLGKKVRGWLEEEKDFKPMPDGLGYFSWHENLNLYIEVLSWDKILKDSSMRNRIFFHKLGINS